MLHRLRTSFENSSFKTKLGNEVEIDETFIGGKNKNRHWDKKVPRCQGRNWKDKIPIWGARERDGKRDGSLIAQVVSNTQKNTLEQIIKNNIELGSTVYTDEWLAYQGLSKWFNHQWVNHSAKQYVNEKATTNRVENAWSHLKRSIYGIYHQISRKHAQKYVDEFTFRFNTRKHSKQERFNLALSSVVGKRLTYQQLIN